MENKNIIIILIVIIVILAAAIGFALFNPTTAKEPTKIKITSDNEQYENDGELSIKLTDLNKTPISKEVVNITITNKKGKVVVDDVVKTDSKGKAKLDLDLKKGKYVVNVTYGGNENYSASNATQKLTIKEEEVVVEDNSNEESYSGESSSSSNGLHYDSEINVYYNDEGIAVDPDGNHPMAAGHSYAELREDYERWERGELDI
jgi:ABC-type Na+ efflux pump permease subunit